MCLDFGLFIREFYKIIMKVLVGVVVLREVVMGVDLFLSSVVVVIFSFLGVSERGFLFFVVYRIEVVVICFLCGFFIC